MSVLSDSRGKKMHKPISQNVKFFSLMKLYHISLLMKFSPNVFVESATELPKHDCSGNWIVLGAQVCKVILEKPRCLAGS